MGPPPSAIVRCCPIIPINSIPQIRHCPQTYRLIFNGYSTSNGATNFMSKTLIEAQITTTNARSRLGLGAHWRRLDAEAHLGYRKGKQSGVWFVRWRNHHKGGNYKQVS